jgi:hypothetical protein
VSFLTLNDLVVAVIGGGMAPEYIGERTRAYNGDLLSDDRIIKRPWRFTTPPLKEIDANALIGLINGLGHSWTFDWSDAALLTQDLWSASGLGFASTVGATRWGFAADGARVYDIDEHEESKYGTGALTVDGGTTNLLTANQRDVEDDASGFTAIATGAILPVTSDKLQGSKSLKVTANAADDGVRIDQVAASASTAYSGVVYVKPPDATSLITVSLHDDDTGLLDDTDVNPSATFENNWVRVEVSGTTGGSATAAWIEVTIDTGTKVFYIDANQLEQSATPTTWADGTRAAGDLRYSPTFLQGSSDMTINCWTKEPTANPGSNVNLVTTRETATTNSVRIIRSNGANDVQFRTNDEDAAGDNLTYATTPWDGDWHMVTCVLRANPETGENKKTIYFDGVSVATSDPAKTPVLTNLANLWIANSNGGNYWQGIVDEMQILPFAATPELVTAWFGLGRALTGLPRLRAEGDFTRDSFVTVDGRVTAAPYLRRQDGASWRNNMRSIEFELAEV